ncbi:MAG: hypothetical protein HC941_09900 [Microcoleus sp. SU_5_3]|nr:hypothetical protein [Microcoleus sp. SU_5_3]
MIELQLQQKLLEEGGFVEIFGYGQISLIKPAPTANICTSKLGSIASNSQFSPAVLPFYLYTHNYQFPVTYQEN